MYFLIIKKYMFFYRGISCKWPPRMQRDSGRVMGGSRLWESVHKGSLPRGEPDPNVSTLWKSENYCIQSLSYDMCSSMFSLKVLCILWVAQCVYIAVNKKIRPWGVKQLLTRSLKQCKVINRQPKMWSWSHMEVWAYTVFAAL